MALIEVGDKKIEIKDLTQRMRKRIQGFAYKAFKNPEYVMEMNLDTVALVTGLSDEEIEKEYSDNEVNEIADRIAAMIQITSEQKKS